MPSPTTGTAPICMDFERAGSIVGPLTGNGIMDGEYCFQGTAAAWSLTN